MASWDPFSSITNIEEEFVSFYCHAITKIYLEKMTLTNWVSKCREALTILKKMNYEMVAEQRKPYYNFFNFLDHAVRFAYVYSFSIINTCTVYRHALKFFNQNEDFNKIIRTKTNIRICCLGGGPGIEAVAICKLINDSIKLYFNSSCANTSSHNSTSVVSIHVTIVDICFKWENEAMAILNAAKKSIASERVTIDISIIRADLLDRFRTNFVEEMKKADIITMVGLGNEIMERNPEKLSALCENLSRIVQLMKVGSCLFIQESGGGPAFYHLKESLCNTILTNVESYEDEGYSLLPSSLDKFFCFVPGELGPDKFPPVCHSSVSSCIWVQT